MTNLDNIETREIIEFSDVQKLVMDFVDRIDDLHKRTNELNKKLLQIVMIAFICMTITIVGISGFYFCADYSTAYPEVTQEQSTLDSEQKQEIGRGE